MIEKLYQLKKTQIDRKLMEKGQLLGQINAIETELAVTQAKINTTGVQPYGAISDFTILQIHKNTMKLHMSKLNAKKRNLEKKHEVVVNELVELQKESEQYNYILQEEKKEKMKALLAAEEEAASEYMQSKYIRG
ncbi:hypothetical protein CPU12_08745 [Malaciobacter molluscorum LMG 25693]|uniref:Flagellar FliJ protein n=1 Tax=Malaciobacter molluscorum LMG 25693 TaxID=870501 RepID=A0A2G1DHM3_9BACT|nr:hypothetical protein [Malaciobacter molluscorum]AXX93434.1 hypothetical protein AMOL_2492 [Malaciobacter molluscorum LMG 25693]PHO17836.1 hypothetical protein CPU12_08745 [Malaciobacter molluscorum LMG 25693]RXJ95048.1 hypothetical protein CRV00_04645 [Malaciobacter molluscorum]